MARKTAFQGYFIAKGVQQGFANRKAKEVPRYSLPPSCLLPPLPHPPFLKPGLLGTDAGRDLRGRNLTVLWGKRVTGMRN